MQDFTEGKISAQLIRFSIPFILGNLFQLTYHAVDTIVIGKYAGQNALAAVGATNPVINLVILGISGVSIGASVLMSEFYGARKMEQLKKEMATIMLFGGAFSLIIALCGFLLTPWILRLLQVPVEILPMAALYLRVIFLGTPFTCFYNMLAAAMRSVGDAKTPIYFLAIASVLNGSLDILFIAGLHWSVWGAALATIVAEGISALLCMAQVHCKIPVLQVTRKEFHIDRLLLKQTLAHGSVTALQQACQPIGKLLIQRVINAGGVEMIAAFQAVSRVDDFAFTPEQSISHAMMSFIAQNRGAGKTERVQQGFRMGLRLECSYWLLLCAIILCLKEPIMWLFISGEGETMVGMGVQYLSLMAFFYILPGFTNGLQGYFRGMGQMPVTLASTLIQISFRVLFVYLLTPSMGLIGVAYACLIGWICMLATEVPYYFWFQKRHLSKNQH